MNNDKLFKSDDFIIYQEGGSIKSLNMKLSVDTKEISKLSVPLPLNLIMNKEYNYIGGSKEKIEMNEDKEVRLIDEGLYDELLKLSKEDEIKRKNRTKKKKFYIKKKSNKRNTRKL